MYAYIDGKALIKIFYIFNLQIILTIQINERLQIGQQTALKNRHRNLYLL